jgi:hypothetical protein
MIQEYIIAFEGQMGVIMNVLSSGIVHYVAPYSRETILQNVIQISKFWLQKNSFKHSEIYKCTMCHTSFPSKMCKHV